MTTKEQFNIINNFLQGTPVYYRSKYSSDEFKWKHEEEMKRLEKWNGVQVSTQSVYVPNTYDLKSGK